MRFRFNTFAIFACLTLCMVTGVALGCWMAVPAARLAAVHSAVQRPSDLILLPVLCGAVFVLAIRLASCLRFSSVWLAILFVLRGCMFGYWFSLARARGSAVEALTGVLLSMLVLGLGFASACRQHSGAK